MVAAIDEFLSITASDGSSFYYHILSDGCIVLYTTDPMLIGTSVGDGYVYDTSGHQIYQLVGTTDPTDGDDLALIAVT